MSFSCRRLGARTLWLKLHTYLALSAGLLFVVIGLSGSLAVYREELDALLNPRLSAERPGREMLSLDRIMAAVHKAHPKRYAPWTLEMPRSSRGLITAWYERPDETRERRYAPLMVSVDPYTAEVVASRFWGETASTWLADLHTQLLADRAGWNLVGMLGVLLAISAGSGLYLWWPGLVGLRRVLVVRHDAGAMRFVFDLHRGIGFLGMGWLLLVAFTGVNLAFPRALEGLSASAGMGHGNEGPEIRSTAIPNDRPVGMAAAVLIARGLFPRSEVRRITQPAGETGSYRINLRQLGEINQRHPFTTVWVDRWSGQILEVRNPTRFSTGESLLAWLWPLHTGEAFGGSGRFAWFCAGSLPLLLYLSGLLRWAHGKGWVQDRPLDLPGLGLRAKRFALARAARVRQLLCVLAVFGRQGWHGLLARIGRLWEK